MHCVIETDAFARQARTVGLSEDERHRITTALGDDPMLGDLIQGAGGARKFRVSKPGMGKRSGYRVISYYAANDVPVFLLDILDKGERLNLTEAEKHALKKSLGRIADDYRNATKEKIKYLQESA